ncbi:MAG: YbaK/EbsC family protein [Anaerolineaceae bacterium]|jgi:prolyl-tRNA editing enzyme YbaK/EbsC (Cys-tRNA(Pro) deacylase)
MEDHLHASAQKVQVALAERNFSGRVVELPASTRTAQEAAAAIGCTVAQIVKSLVFRGLHSGRPILVEISGINRVAEQRLTELLGEPVEKASADFVRAQTGFSIGGVPPVGHANPILTIIDEDLFQYAEIWAAAGTPHAVFPLTPADLQRLTGGKVAVVRK